MSDVLVDSSTNTVSQKQNNKSPMVRFDGFTDDWEQRKLKEVAEFNPKSELPNKFEYIDLESVVGTNLISHRTENKDSAPSRAQRLARKGDVFYQTVRPYQKNNYLFDLPYIDYVFSTGYAQMRPNIDSYFLLNCVQEERFVKAVLDRSTGTSYPAINSKDLADIKIKVPKESGEQEKIGILFNYLDKTIALHQRKLGQLIFQKKYLLQNIFPKKRVTNRVLKISDDICSDERMCDMFSLVSSKGRTDIPFVTVKEYETIERSSAIQGYGNDMSENAKQKAKIILKNQFLIDLSSFEHGIYKASMDGLTSNAYFVLNLDHGCHDYWSRFFTSHNFIQSLKKLTPPGARQGKMIEVKAFLNESYMVPSLEEQQKIGALFNAMDHRIQVQETKIKQLQEMKKAILQRMFV